MNTDKKPVKILVAHNAKARFDYAVEDSLWAGIVLKGSEAKSFRQKTVNISGAYAHIDNNGECWISGLHITTYNKTNTDIPEPLRERKLLLSKREIAKLQIMISRAGYTLIPLEISFIDKWAKVLLGVCKGKNHKDKREALKEKAIKREARNQ